MDISEFVGQFNTHPVLFIGTGISLRYLEKSFTWDGLLSHIAYELTENDEYYLDLKSENNTENGYDFTSIATELEKEFNSKLKNDRNGKFKNINDIFYENAKNNYILSRFKIYISILTSNTNIKLEYKNELNEFKMMKKNISSIITTNYDQLLENITGFEQLIGNDILLSNPYGSIYKIHGCISDPKNIIITEEDYKSFNKKYELIRAQLLSIFIHNPIIFLGYGIGDSNIKDILKTIFSYVDVNTELAIKIKNNFLLVEYDKESMSVEIEDHTIDLEGFSTISINKLRTNNFISLYKTISSLTLPVSALDIRKVQNIVKDIYSGGSIRVSIEDDIDNLQNNEKILAIGSSSNLKYVYTSASSMISSYFNLLKKENSETLKLIDDITIQTTQWFPIYGFSIRNKDITKIEILKKQQKERLLNKISKLHRSCMNIHKSIEDINDDDTITTSNKLNAIFYSIYNRHLDITVVESYLKDYKLKDSPDYRMLICCYDYIKYSEE